MQEQQKEAFREEAYELLSELESSLLELEENPEDQDLVGQVFRAMHTIKGSGSMFGFDDISAFTHDVETVFDLVRDQKIPVTNNLVNLSLSARDQILAMLDAGTGQGTVDEVQTRRLTEQFRALIPGQESDAATMEEEPQTKPDGKQECSYRIWFKPCAEIFLSGTNPVALLNELRDLGSCHIRGVMDDLPELEGLNPELCYSSWEIKLTTDRGRGEIEDVFIFVEDESEIHIDLLDAHEAAPAAPAAKDTAPLPLQSEQPQSPGRSKAPAENKSSANAEASIRVPASKLDSMVDLVGELVTIQSRLSQTAAGREDAELMSIAEEVERLTGELRDNILNIRMLPIGSTFSKFKRLVRDLSQELGKNIELKTSGADTELDKTVIEKLNDPLIHLIRNSLDHGIETPEERKAAGKSEVATVHLAAIHSGDSVIIEINDDGRGINIDAIRSKAIEKGLIAQSDELSDKELFQLLFAPGFSTAKTISSVSGRGVGMDVVKRAIEALRGSIEISSSRGEGTRVSIRIPLTLAIIESLLVGIGNSKYVLPLNLVEECIELSREDVERSHGRSLAKVRGHLVPYIPLREHFDTEGTRPDIEQIVIANINGSQVGFVVDHVVGEHQTVIKSLGPIYRDAQGVSGATILGDGTVALILDVSELMKGAMRDEASVPDRAACC